MYFGDFNWSGTTIKRGRNGIFNVSWILYIIGFIGIFFVLRILQHEPRKITLRIAVDKKNLLSLFCQLPADVEG
ncbi:hypothetical protein U879_18680 [Defluviimonas sp. 20V17]|nr:hypothetical protein U879_18680 [Defluviimonas sp. 20V17]